MAKFVFRLEKVRKYRKWQEKQSQQQLAAASTERELSSKKLEAAEKKAERHNREYSQRVSGGVQAGEALIDSHYAAKLHLDREECFAELEEREEALSKRRQELVTALQRRRILDILREKRRDEYQRNAERQEQSVMDDDAGRRHLALANSSR